MGDMESRPDEGPGCSACLSRWNRFPLLGCSSGCWFWTGLNGGWPPMTLWSRGAKTADELKVGWFCLVARLGGLVEWSGSPEAWLAGSSCPWRFENIWSVLGWPITLESAARREPKESAVCVALWLSEWNHFRDGSGDSFNFGGGNLAPSVRIQFEDEPGDEVVFIVVVVGCVWCRRGKFS